MKKTCQGKKQKANQNDQFDHTPSESQDVLHLLDQTNPVSLRQIASSRQVCYSAPTMYETVWLGENVLL